MNFNFRYMPAKLTWLLLLILIGWATLGETNAHPQDVELLARWAGDLPVDRLDLLPEGQRLSSSGYIGDPSSFAAIWQAMQPDAIVPMVDFVHNLVIFVRNVDFYNRTSILNVTLTGGEARILAMQTMSAMPIQDKVAMAMAVVPRSGIEFILAGDVRIRVTDHR